VVSGSMEWFEIKIMCRSSCEHLGAVSIARRWLGATSGFKILKHAVNCLERY